MWIGYNSIIKTGRRFRSNTSPVQRGAEGPSWAGYSPTKKSLAGRRFRAETSGSPPIHKRKCLLDPASVATPHNLATPTAPLFQPSILQSRRPVVEESFGHRLGQTEFRAAYRKQTSPTPGIIGEGKGNLVCFQ